MEKAKAPSRTLRLALAFVLAFSMSVPVYAYGDEPADNATAKAGDISAAPSGDASAQAASTVPAAGNAVSVDGVEYADLAAAAAAIKNGSTVKLLDNVTVEGERNALRTAGLSYTIDLGGFTFTANTTNAAFISVDGADGADAEVTIKNGTLVAGPNAFCAVITEGYQGGTSTVNLEGVTVRNSRPNGAALKAFPNSIINVKTGSVVSSTEGAGCATAAGGTLNIYDGVFSQSGFYDHNSTCVSASNGGAANVYGGLFTASEGYGAYVFNSGATITIENGVFAAGKAVLKADKPAKPTDAPSVIDVRNGDFQGEFSIMEGASAVLFGGTYVNADGSVNTKAAQYLAEGLQLDPATGEVISSAVATVTNAAGEVTRFDSITAAIESVPTYDYSTNKGVYIITLMRDTSEDVVVTGKKRIELDLAGHTLTNVSDHTILNRNTYNWTIKDSVGTGVVDNVTHAKGALYNDINAKVTVKGGLFTRSAEGAGNTWYVIKNFGTMTIADGTTVTFPGNTGQASALVANGWYNSASAEAGTSSEPKPSLGGNKATLTINGGNFTGSDGCVLKNDDYGKLTVNGGLFTSSSTASSSRCVFNSSTAKIVDGKFSSIGACVESTGAPGTAANPGTLEISGGSFSSQRSPVLTVDRGTTATISSGVFTGEAENAIWIKGASKVSISAGLFVNKAGGYIIEAQSPAEATVAISGGRFVKTTEDKIVNVSNSFVEGYGPVDKDGDGTFDATVIDPLVVIKTPEGIEIPYLDFSLAAKVAPAGSTIVLQKDVVLAKQVKTDRYGITVDLNGHNVDGSAVTASDGAICLMMKYGTKPAPGDDVTMRLVNSQTTGGVVKAKVPLGFASGDSSVSIPGVVGENVTLEVLEGGSNAVYLKSSAYLMYTDKIAATFKNGGFKTTASDGERIYSSPANASAASVDHVVELLSDYTGSETIYSGSSDATLDLQSHTYTYTSSSNSAIKVNYSVHFTVKNGTVKATGAKADGADVLEPNASLTLDGVTLDVAGPVYGIVTNGTIENDAVTLNNSVLNVPNGLGIYFPSSGSVTIVDSRITAKDAGVQMCSGTLNVSETAPGKTSIIATGDPVQKTEGDGGIADGAAISLVNRNYPGGAPQAAITGGTFESASTSEAVKAYTFGASMTEEPWESASKNVDVSGGTFSSEVPYGLCADGLACEAQSAGTFAIVADTSVAQVLAADGSKLAGYGTLEEAVKAATDGQTVKLLQNVTLDKMLNVSGKNRSALTLDLGGCAITSTVSSYAIAATSGIDLAIANGTLEMVSTTGNTTGLYAQQSSVTTANLKITGAVNGMQIGNSIANQPVYWGEVTVNDGTVIENVETGIMVAGPYLVQGAVDVPSGMRLTKATVNGGTINANSYAISGNGTMLGTEIVVNGGTLAADAAEGAGIYHPQLGTLTLNGGEISGAIGVQMCAGTLDVPSASTAKIASRASDNRADKAEGDGAIIDGAAVSFIDRGYPGGAPAASISGGTFTAENPQAPGAVLDYAWDGAAEPGQRVSDWATAGDSIGVSGGTFSSEVPGDLCAEGFAPKDNGDSTFGVETLPEGAYLLDRYKGTRASSDWIAPAQDGKAFAGWYADASLQTPCDPSQTTGQAYAKFVTAISDAASSERGVAHFMGGSLRMDNAAGDFSTTSLRFGYQITLPAGASIDWENTGWRYATGDAPAAEGSFATVQNFRSSGSGYIANVVFTNVPAASYATPVHTLMTVAYTTADGTHVTIAETAERTRSVLDVANAIANSASAPQAEKEYAAGLIQAAGTVAKGA